MDERGMNLLESMVVIEISKDDDGNVIVNFITTSFRPKEVN
jgi:hypothetical protein